MMLHYLQHVPFEGPGFIEEWATFREMQLSSTRLYAGEHLPAIDSFDWLVVMGGPMGIYDEGEHNWLADEKAFLRASIDAGKTVVGICLGAQLIADVLGARVYPGEHKEIGWFPVRRNSDAPAWVPEEFMAFHWHGDTFDLPQGAVPLGSSDACENQGFIYQDRVIALQFHLESTHQSIEDLIEHCADELGDGPYIQSAMQIRSSYSELNAMNVVLSELLDQLPKP